MARGSMVEHGAEATRGSAPDEPVTVKATSGDPTHEQKDTTCHLMRLPAELRNSIYELVIVRPFAITIGSNMGGSKDKDGQLPAITRTNRQIRNEALSIFLGANTFDVYLHYDYGRFDYGQYDRCDLRPALSGAHSWLGRMVPDQRRQIKEIVLCTPLTFESLVNMGHHIWNTPAPVRNGDSVGASDYISSTRVSDTSPALRMFFVEKISIIFASRLRRG
ncbi:hypothetical protein LTR56_012598 [Elasticomyces elasticus]|nr:hypothetical protein LTR22_018473 [Elasticomyces elasticus]KAK3639238.1 hypothetical protein LTR56_012598 [Elasticomyces elasticus]KAK4912542.1 hypothetical protein LTR49_019009 [Elasticomyces elasticus]